MPQEEALSKLYFTTKVWGGRGAGHIPEVSLTGKEQTRLCST